MSGKTGNQPPKGPAGPGTSPGAPGGPPRGKAGAMTMAMQAVPMKAQGGPKVLRIGLIQGGKIVEERVIRSRETVSVGSSERNHFVVHSPGLPSRFELFQLVGSDYILNFTDTMKGKVGLTGGVQDLEQLRKSGGARNANTHWQIKLNDTSRGKVVVGEVTLLFQFVTPPPIQPRPQLPAAAMGGMVKSIDWLFTAISMFCFQAIFGFIVFAESFDSLLVTGVSVQQARLIVAEIPPPELPEDETPPEPDAEGEAEAEAESPAPTKAPSKNDRPSPSPSTERDNSDAQARAQAQAEANARIAQEEAARAVQQVMTGLSGSNGALNDVLNNGAASGSSQDVLDQSNGVGVARNSSAGSLRQRGGGGNGSGVGGDIGNMVAAGGAEATAARDEGTTVVEIRIKPIAPSAPISEGGSGELDPDAVVRAVRGRLGGIKRCYEAALRQNSALRGKVEVSFSVQESGSLSGVRASEDSLGDAGVTACILGQVRGIRINPGPTGGSVDFSYPFVFEPSQ